MIHHSRGFLGIGLPAAVLLVLPEMVFAAEEAVTPQSASNTMWTLIGAILVMFMQPGFALVECGLTRAKNAANIMMKNFMDFVIGTLMFFVAGFGLMFGDSISGFVGSNFFALTGFDGSTPEGQWALTFWFFQAVFCATAATIVSGAVAERTKFSAYLMASVVISSVIYPISGHWAWGGLFGNEGGWLESMGFIDFAGSTVVHSVGGWLAFAGAIVVGPRLGKYSRKGEARAIPGHNLSMAALGVFVLWFAWFGFNCGSTTTADGTIGYIAASTCLAAAAGALTSMLTTWVKMGKPDPSMTFNGVLAGLVGVTAGCFEMSPVGAIATGAVCGVLVVCSVFFIDQILKVDDPVGAISVHGVCGAAGTLLVGLFAAPGYGTNTGLFYGGGTSLLMTQAVGVVAVFVWAFVGGLILFKGISLITQLRVSREDELKGLDITEHGVDAYSGFQIFSNE